MAPDAPGDARRPTGRPARISRSAIAEAASAIGLEGLTLKAVAERLGVGVPSLYHHIGGRDDLLQLAAEHAVTSLRIPADRGQHWAVWLLEWARYNRDAFVAQPALLGQFLEGGINPQAIAENAEAILDLLCRQGFEVREAEEAYELVSSCAVGAATAEIRLRRAAETGRSVEAARARVLAERPADELPRLRALHEAEPRHSFEDRIATVLAGIATRRGDDWSEIAGLLEAVAPATTRPEGRT